MPPPPKTEIDCARQAETRRLLQDIEAEAKKTATLGADVIAQARRLSEENRRLKGEEAICHPKKRPA